MKNTIGKLITFEGIDGAGKSTQVRLFTDYLERSGIDFVSLREPTNGKWGREIRSALENNNHELLPEEAFRLFTMDRRENVEKNILPALRAGKIVVLDRYYFSSIAYQGVLDVDPEKIRSINESFAPKPALVFLLEIAPHKGIERITKGRKQKLTLYEKSDYLAKVQEIFDSMKDPCIRRIDASVSAGIINEKIIKVFQEL